MLKRLFNSIFRLRPSIREVSSLAVVKLIRMIGPIESNPSDKTTLSTNGKK